MFLADIPLNIDWQQILLHLLNFVILIGGLYFILYKPVKNFMAKRQEYYKQEAEETEKMSQSVKQKNEQIEQRLASLEEEAQQQRLTLNKDLEVYREQELKKAKEEAQAIIDKAKVDAEKLKKETVESINKEIKDLVLEATGKIVLKESASQAYDQFLDAANKGEDNGKNS